MKVLFTTQPSFGHWHPLVPLAHALQAAGHEVAFATTPSFAGTIEAKGFRCFHAGPEETQEEMLSYRERLATVDPLQRADFHLKNVYAVRAARTLSAVLDIVREWRPDALVRENTELAGCIAARKLGVVHAAVQITPTWSTFLEVLAEPLARICESVGLPPEEPEAIIYRDLLLSPRPASLWNPAVPVPPTAVCFRNPDFSQSGEEELPAWVSQLGGRPTVYASLGTYYNRATEVLTAIVRGLRDEPIELILTVGRSRDPAELGAQPPNVHIERYVPQSLLLPYCDAMVFHGGSGTMMGALGQGLPMVILPIAAEQPENARRCLGAGAARVIDPNGHPALADAIRDATREVLTVPDYRRAAERVRREIDALPGVEDAVVSLERLVAERRPWR
jgi:UDP:flavonoid glycosyltransferase YjiC (YdhE family)